jgi:hypothetical protein
MIFSEEILLKRIIPSLVEGIINKKGVKIGQSSLNKSIQIIRKFGQASSLGSGYQIYPGPS